MGNRGTSETKRVISNLFGIPKGASDVLVRKEGAPLPPPVEVNPTGQGVILPPIDGAGNDNVFLLATPQVIQVIDQKLRRAPGGQQVVDIVLSVEDIIGANDYEIQIAKV